MKTIRMKKADWEKWDTALRSGEYKQAPNALFDGVGYCCLGVLQHCLDSVTEKPVDDELPSKDWLEAHGIEFADVAHVYHAVCRNPSLTIGDVTQSAAEFNDDRSDETGIHMYTFVDIADAIKEAVEFTDA